MRASLFYLLSAPVAVLLLAFFLPIARIVWQSLWTDSGAFTLDNYVRLFTTPVYTHGLAWTFELALGVSVASAVVAYPIAYAMANGGPRLRWLLLACTMLPLWTSSLARTVSWVQILGAHGVINWVLTGLGLVDAPLRLLFNQFAVYAGSIHDKTPYMVLCLYGSMINIDRNLVRTAETLGAGRIRAFFLAYVPQTMPGMAAGMILVFINALGLYSTPVVLGGSSARPFVVLVQQAMNVLLDWGFAAALSTLLVIATFGCYLLVARHLGATAGTAEPQQSGPARVYRLLSVTDRLFAWSRTMFRSRRGRRPGASLGLPIWTAIAILLGLLLACPVLLIVVLAFSTSYTVVFPPPGFSLRLFQMYFSGEEWLDATITSFVIAASVGICTVALAVPAVLGLRQISGRPAAILSGFMLTPMMVPTVVYGAAAYMQFVGVPYLDRELILIVTHTALAFPPTLLLLLAATQGLDQRLEDAAASLGASPWRRFRFIVLPLIAPGAVAGALVAFLTSFDELGVALFITNNDTMTLPKRMLDAVVAESDPRAIPASAVLILISLIVLLGIHFLQRDKSMSNARVGG